MQNQNNSFNLISERVHFAQDLSLFGLKNIEQWFSNVLCLIGHFHQMSFPYRFINKRCIRNNMGALRCMDQ